MLSTRRDLCTPAIADQLAILQDKIQSFEDARAHIQRSIGQLLEN